MAAVDIPREERRNRLLRRADWRFLLPDPQPNTIACFGGGKLAEAAALIAERVTDGRCDLAADLAVAANPRGATLRTAWAALRPGGFCYTEWYTPLVGGQRGVERRLAAAGFEQIACYWPWPWPARGTTLFWLPLDAPDTLRAFFDSRTPAGVSRQIGYALRRALWLLSLRTGLTLPICATARKPPRPVSSPRSTAATPHDFVQPARDERADLLETIRAGWSDWGFGPAPDRIAWLLLTGGRRSINKVVGLVAAERDGRPRIAVKLPRVPESVVALRREAATLRAIHARRPGGVPGVPRVLLYQECASFAVLAETALAGQPLFTQLRRRSYRELALKGTDWLADLAGRSEPRPRASWWSRLVEAVLAQFVDSFGSIADPGMIRETHAQLVGLGDLPLVCEQRDFSPWNVLLAADGALVVLDWESAELDGLPAMDLIYFLTYLAFFLDGAMESGRFRESYRAMRDRSIFTGRVQAECLERYAAGVGIDPAVIRPLRLLTWLLHSHSEYQQFAADAAGRPERETLRRSLFVSLWEEELR